MHCCGATTEDLHHAVVPRLLETGLLTSFSQQWGDLTPLLEKIFEFESETARWHLRPGTEVRAKITRRAVIRYAVLRHLNACQRVDRPTTEAETYAQVRALLPGKQSATALLPSILSNLRFSDTF